MAKDKDQERSLSSATPRTDEAKATLKEQEKQADERPAPEAGKPAEDEQE